MIENELDELSLYIPKDIYNSLERIAMEKGTTISGFVIEELDSHLKRQSQC